MKPKLNAKIVITLILVLFYSTFAQVKNYTILISLDGFRWDYPERGFSPNLEYIKNNGVHALSLKPCFPSKTFPNHYSIITGMYPENHGIISNNFTNPATHQKYSLYDSIAVRDPKWYKGEAIWETAKRQGVITASYFWPGSELTEDYRRPDYFEKFVYTRPYHERVEGVLNWLQLPFDKRPHFITLYFDATDTSGHNYGPNSIQINQSIALEDSMLGLLINGLKKINLLDSTNIIVISDHGMAQLSSERVINIDKLLTGFKFKTADKGTMMFIYPDEKDKQSVYKKLKDSEKNYRVFWRDEIPAYLHFNKNHLIAEVVIIADNGYSLFDGKDVEKYTSKFPQGNHGYDPEFIDMHGIFFAMGPDFKVNYTCGTIENIHIYPLLAKILKIFPNNNIDGKPERIEYLLKDPK